MAWFGNDVGGHMAQSIINGTDKIVREPHKEMTKCPNCGSTAQIKISTPPSVYGVGLVITTHKCGCGCVFERRYKLSEIKIITKGE